MTRFSTTRVYYLSAAVALGLAAFFSWWAMSWIVALIPAVLFVAVATVILSFAFQPSLAIQDSHFAVGKRLIPWRDIRRVDQTGWMAPLIIFITLASGERLRIVYPGDQESGNMLLGMIQQRAMMALINGVPYRRIFGDPVIETTVRTDAEVRPRYRILREEDEAEVERLYQKLKTAGHLDPEK